MIYNVDQKKFRKRLIRIYSNYVSDDKAKNGIAKKDAKKADGLWSGAFMLDKDIESAIGGLVWLYIAPEMDKEKARTVLESLKNADRK